MKKVFISTTSFADFSKEPLDLLENNNIDFAINSKGRKLSETETASILMQYDAVIAGTEMYTKEVLDELSQLKVISRLGVGMDNIDLDEAKRKGINVFKTQTTPCPAVAELALGLMLDLARKISYQNNALKSGDWIKKMGNLLYGKTMGIIGLGSIGKTLVRLTKGFNFQLLAFDLYHDEQFASENNVNYCDLDILLSDSDIVTIHLNLTDDTNQLLDSSKISKMKPGSILINTSRGEIINENALLNALQENKILGAGLDVYNEEPYGGALLELDNTILTPHIGSYAKELRIKMETEAVENLIRGLNEI